MKKETVEEAARFMSKTLLETANLQRLTLAAGISNAEYYQEKIAGILALAESYRSYDWGNPAIHQSMVMQMRSNAGLWDFAMADVKMYVNEVVATSYDGDQDKFAQDVLEYLKSHTFDLEPLPTAEDLLFSEAECSMMVPDWTYVEGLTDNQPWVLFVVFVLQAFRYKENLYTILTDLQTIAQKTSS